MAQLIKADGTTEQLELPVPSNSKGLKILQEAVGGYIEVVPSVFGGYIVLDEEGKLKGKPVNLKASALAVGLSPWDSIVGDVVIADTSELD